MTELTDIGELYARQNMLEFMMEVFLANELARSDAFSSEAYKEDLLDRFRCLAGC